jgi:FkbM family methyltransferase
MNNIPSYSQNGQDIKILEILNYKKNGYFLDIGCAHFKKLSNTYALEKSFSWNGLCVDPRYNLKHNYEINRKCAFEEAAIYTHTGKICFRDVGVLSGIDDESITDKTPDKRLRDQKIYDVPCITFHDLFQKYDVPSIIDYMSLDVEGAELLILETFPFSKYTLMTASIEHNSHLGVRQKEKGEKILKLMEDNNFKVVAMTKQDFIMANKKLIFD